MRLSVLDHGHRPLQKLKIKLMRLIIGRAPPPVLMMSYRRDLFGKHFSECTEEAMREATEWTIFELEIFAAFVSRQNQCLF
jgi:hypothetical protein